MARRKLKIVKTKYLHIGVAASSSRTDHCGTTLDDPFCYCMRNCGTVRAAGKQIIARDKLPSSSIIRPDLYKERFGDHKAFTEGDEVVVTLDCTAHTLRLQTPVVDHTISILQQHWTQQQWVLNVNFGGGDIEVKLS